MINTYTTTTTAITNNNNYKNNFFHHIVGGKISIPFLKHKHSTEVSTWNVTMSSLPSIGVVSVSKSPMFSLSLLTG